MKVKFIKSFMFQLAEYKISDGERSVILKINYQANKFSIEHQTQISDTFKNELEEIAKDLLLRKHAVNFAKA